MVDRRLCSLLCALALSSHAIAARQPTLEYDVKAAFILNFARYVEWPPPRRTPPLRICVLATNPFGTRLDAVVAGEGWHGGGIDVRQVADMRAAVGCHLLYVPRAASDRFVKGISAIAGEPVLTVGESDTFLEQGGIIHLFLEQNRVRFSINQKTADAVGLQISSRLLRLARQVIAGNTP